MYLHHLRKYPLIGYSTSSFRLRPVSGESPRRKLVIPVKLAPMATNEAEPTPSKSRLWNVDASGANCSAGGLPYWVPFSFRSPEDCVRYVRWEFVDFDAR